MQLPSIIRVTAVTVFLNTCGLSLGLHIKVPFNKADSILGQEEIGPIENYTCVANGVFPHEDCEKYVSCWQNQAVLYQCTEIMLFDLRYNGCNYAEYVDCGDRNRPPTYPGTETPPATTTTQDPSISTAPTTPPPNGTFECTTNGVFPHSTRCEYYWSCYEGEAQLIHCELDYLFDLRYNGCNFPELTDCQERERPIGVPSTITPPEGTRTTTTGPSGGTQTTEPGNNSTSTVGPGFQCPQPNGKFPDPADCTSFYSCVENIPIHESCPPGLHFNPKLETCDWPDQAGCEVV